MLLKADELCFVIHLVKIIKNVCVFIKVWQEPIKASGPDVIFSWDLVLL